MSSSQPKIRSGVRAFLIDLDGVLYMGKNPIPEEMGMQGILVKTGKYREDNAKSTGVKPDMVLESLADLAEHL